MWGDIAIKGLVLLLTFYAGRIWEGAKYDHASRCPYYGPDRCEALEKMMERLKEEMKKGGGECGAIRFETLSDGDDGAAHRKH